MIAGLLLSAALAAAPQDMLEATEWDFSFDNMTPRYDGDTVLQLFEAPVFRSGSRELRASWLVVWFDRSELEKNPSAIASESAEDVDELRRRLADIDLAAEGGAPSLFARFRDIEKTRLAQEIYLEGPIVYTENGAPVGRAGAVYLDMIDGHGWIADASISVERSIRGQVSRLRVIADWLRHSADGSLRANDAIVTSCGFEDPHFHVRSGDLRIIPRPERGVVEFDVQLRHNELRLSESFAIPLPKLSYPAGSDYTPKYEGFRLGNSARFGTFAEAEVNGDASRASERVARFLGVDTSGLPRGRSKLKLRWLGSRGILLDGSARLEADERFRWELELGGLPDRGDDRGIVRVDEGERDTLRAWGRSRGRFFMDRQEWLDLSLTTQTDPGVQSEFWERDYVRYEHRDSYLHWRQARNEYYYDATVLTRLDSFRTEVEELPRLGLSRFPSELFRLGDQPVLYGTRTTAAYLQRVEGRDATAPSLFAPSPPLDGREPPFDDLLGERRVLRFDTRHTLESPLSLPFAGARLVPFVEGRATAWDRGVDEDDSPGRWSVAAGARLATTFWKRLDGGGLHELTPFASVRSELDGQDTDGEPVRFDSVEDRVRGDLYQVGVRSRWLQTAGVDAIDLEVRGSYQADVEGEQDRWLPLGLFGSLYRDVLGIPVSIWHDSRHDFDAEQTVYSLTAVGLQPSERWGLELAHQRGRDDAGDALFEAASVASRFRWSPKWELEAQVSFPILDDGEERTQLVLRRLGHDFLFEIEFEDRTGEGGASFGISFRPILGWRQAPLGVRDR